MELLSRLRVLAGQEREAVADVIEHLAEMARRGSIPDTGYPTLFDYCTKALGFSDSEAYLRIRVARASLLSRKIIDDLRSGKVHLEAVLRLSAHLTEKNCESLLELAAGATKKEVQCLVASLSPGLAPERDVIRIVAATPPPGLEPTVIPPPSKVRLSFTADGGFLELLDRLKSLRRHRHPAGRLEDMLRDAMEALLLQIDPAAERRRRSQAAGAPGRRWIPRATRRAVWKRDGGLCTYRSDDGTLCRSADFVEIDHIRPYALGGASDDPTNLRLLCRAHNQRRARKALERKTA